MVIKARRSLIREFYCELIERISFCTNVGTNSVTSGQTPQKQDCPAKIGTSGMYGN
ncbi:hypothetical protein DPMN_096844 [Dreissena polymorpha]|uniref:Uncharacterized protein n=1 Tax=Dreissena polymorpha TaxID=45954 RepID=A0A9D4LBV3_DREPO|nr:hypothetical protein DPMN_096844 [Dreissena polymorpha]